MSLINDNRKFNKIILKKYKKTFYNIIPEQKNI